MNDNSNAFWQRALLVLVVIVVLLVIGRAIFVPKSWGELGYYRADAVVEQLERPMVYAENKSCQECHENVYRIKKKSVHHRVSCESCHAPLSEHVKSGDKIAKMPTAQGKSLDELCLSCHKDIVGRPKNFPMIEREQHLKEQDVSLNNRCDQCHTVHAPLENIIRAREMRTLAEEIAK